MTTTDTIHHAAETMRLEDEPVFHALSDWLDDTARAHARATGPATVRATTGQVWHAHAVAVAYLHVPDMPVPAAVPAPRQEPTDLPRVFRTLDCGVFQAAACIVRYSLWTSIGVR